MSAQSAQSSSQTSNMFTPKALIICNTGLSSYGNTSTSNSNEYHLDIGYSTRLPHEVAQYPNGIKIERRKLVNSTVSHTGQCEIDGCLINLNVKGQCTSYYCCYGSCNKKFCHEHDGKHLLTDENWNRVCMNCALKVNYCKKIAMVFFFVILFSLLVFLICLSFRSDDDS